MRVRLSVRPVAVAVFLALSTTVALAGMQQGGLQFRSKDAAETGSYGAPVAPGAPSARQPTNMQYYSTNAPQAAAFRPTPVPIERESSQIKLDIVALYGDEQDKELRRYQAVFEGTYVIRRKQLTDEEKKQWDQAQQRRRRRGLPPQKNKMDIIVFFPFPGSADTVPEATLLVDGKEPEKSSYKQAGVSCELEFLPEQKHEVKVSYRAHGTEDFVYMLEHDERIKQLSYAVTIKGVQRKPILPPKECLDPTTALARQGETYAVAWDYTNLLTQRDIIIQIPAPLFGGDIAHRMPNLIRTGVVSLVLLALLLASGGSIVGKRLTLGQFFLLALPVVMFYFLLLQLSKYASLFLAFALAFVLMTMLVIPILARVQGRRFAWTYGLFGLIVIVGMFSAAALLTKGAGTLVTIAVFALVAYLVYAAPRLPLFQARPERVLPPPPPPPPPPLLDVDDDLAEGEAGESGESGPAPGAVAAEAEPLALPATEPAAPPAGPLPEPPPPAPPPGHYCAYCGRHVEDSFEFCPGCGKPAGVTRPCARCGMEICGACASSYRYCPGCGSALAEQPPAALDNGRQG